MMRSPLCAISPRFIPWALSFWTEEILIPSMYSAVDIGDFYRLIVGKIAVKDFHVTGLEQEIAFPPRNLGELIDLPGRVESLGFRDEPFHEIGKITQDYHVDVEDILYIRPLDLDRYLSPILELSDMDLRQRGRGNRLFIQGFEYFVQRCSQFLFDYSFRLGEFERRHLVLQLGQLDHQIDRDQKWSCGKNLAELDESRPELLHRHADPFGIIPGGEVGGLGKKTALSDPKPRGYIHAPENLAESIFDENLDNLAISLNYAYPTVQSVIEFHQAHFQILSHGIGHYQAYYAIRGG
jgi:hypothetical protein